MPFGLIMTRKDANKQSYTAHSVHMETLNKAGNKYFKKKKKKQKTDRRQEGAGNKEQEQRTKKESQCNYE